MSTTREQFESAAKGMVELRTFAAGVLYRDHKGVLRYTDARRAWKVLAKSQQIATPHAHAHASRDTVQNMKL